MPIDKEIKILKHTCFHCGVAYTYYPDYDPPEAARFCSPECANCVGAGRDDNGVLLAPCEKHKEVKDGLEEE